MHHPPPPTRRIPAALVLLTVLVGTLVAAPAAQAADRGTGFGTWAPLSRTGWHGSMRVGDTHTYCIHPGLPVATDATTDHGTSSDVNGLTPQQLVSINHLVTTYGQTDDPVQAASVAWAVKAIVDRPTTLHSWGYEGDDLAGAIDYIMRRASPENSRAIQERTAQYLAEAEAVQVPRIGGSLALTTDADDPTHGSVSVDVDPDATGTLQLENAIFTDTGTTARENVHVGDTYAITAPASASDDGRPYVVHVTGSFAVHAAAVRLFTTPGQQESAGPAEPTRFELSTQDATPRPVRFSPRIETTARIAAGRFIDEVTVSPQDGVWPRRSDGSFVSVTATADVYRTGAWPAEADEVPGNLTPLAHLSLTTDPSVGAGTYTVQSPELPGPGVYTAVWRIERDAQESATAPHLPVGYRWTERFASPSQTEQVAPPAPTATPVPAPPPAAGAPVPPPAAIASLAATGSSAAAVPALAGTAMTVAGLGAVLWAVARRRRTLRI
ncbi:hypothetical protein SAMN04487848_2834 [Microbacterium sp. ru370.1]|uniref:hypothetical protein n=1 Tax=unclassified Microbacterium TaxID=2609290 RepID=UPI0008917EEF|nr:MULTISPECIES: hypothetical protein [unclassified Microbacterium]SDO98326.1 hypothetical protein SAMN04487848_2834 [Microbacterium sp. ru370.1]SIT92596.1 hypothetical protein SAMN05880579_2746 [Microbacterium sp. RU1D]